MMLTCTLLPVKGFCGQDLISVKENEVRGEGCPLTVCAFL